MSEVDFQMTADGEIRCMVCMNLFLEPFSSCEEAQHHAMNAMHQQNAGQSGCRIIGPDGIQRMMQSTAHAYLDGNQEEELQHSNLGWSNNRGAIGSPVSPSMTRWDSKESVNSAGTSSSTGSGRMTNFQQEHQQKKKKRPIPRNPDDYKQRCPNTNWIWCEVCGNAVNGKDQYQLHLGGKKHKANEEKQRGHKLVEETWTPASTRPIGHGRPAASANLGRRDTGGPIHRVPGNNVQSMPPNSQLQQMAASYEEHGATSDGNQFGLQNMVVPREDAGNVVGGADVMVPKRNITPPNMVSPHGPLNLQLPERHGAHPQPFPDVQQSSITHLQNFLAHSPQQVAPHTLINPAHVHPTHVHPTHVHPTHVHPTPPTPTLTRQCVLYAQQCAINMLNCPPMTASTLSPLVSAMQSLQIKTR